MSKVIKALNRHAKTILGELTKEFPEAKEITCVAVSGGVQRSANGKQQQTKYSIEIEIIDIVNL